MVDVVTGGEQSRNVISDAVKREITQGLQERHGVDKGIAFATACVFYDFETCEGINISCRYMELRHSLQYKSVRCMAC